MGQSVLAMEGDVIGVAWEDIRPHVEEDIAMGMFDMGDERYIQYALSTRLVVQFDTLLGEMEFLYVGVKLSAEETNELARFMVENRNVIHESCTNRESVE